MTSRSLFRFWSLWLIGGLLTALFCYEPLLNSFWGSLAGIFIFGGLVSLPLAWFLTKISKKSWANGWPFARRAFAVMAVSFFIFYAAFSVHKQDNFLTGYDLAIFDQAIWHMSRLEVPQTSVRNLPVIFGDHFDPIITLLAPIYALFPDARTLLVVQAFFLVAGVGIIFLWAKKDKIAPFLAMLLALLYLTHPGIQGAANCDFHEIAFAPVLLLLFFYFLSKRHWRGFFVAAFLLLLVKEEFALWMTAIGVFVVLREKLARPGMAVLGMAAVYFLLVMTVFMPALNQGVSGYAYGSLFPGFEGGVGSGIAGYVSDPGKFLGVLAQDPEKWWSILLYTLPLALPLVFNPMAVILLVPAVATRVLSSYVYLSYAGFYYNVVFAPLAAVFFIYFLKEVNPSSLRRWIESIFAQINVSFPIWALSLAISVNLFFSYGYSYLLDPVYNWRSVNHQFKAEMAELVGAVPKNAAVSASYFMLPQLSQRQNLYILPRIQDAEFVIFDYCQTEACNYWPTGSKNMPEIRAFLAQNPLYRIKTENRAGIVFERTGAIGDAQRAELAGFCQKIIGQSELEPVHRQYLSANCGR